MGLFSLAFFGVELFVPLALTDLRGQPSAIAGLSLTASALTWTAGAWVLERRASRTSRRAMVRLGLILIALGVVGVAVVLVPGTPVLIVPLAWAVAGLGIGLAYSTVQLVVLETAPAGGEGRATAAMMISHTAGIALATGIGGVLVASFGAGEEASPRGLAVQGLLMLGAVALGVVVAGRLPGRPQPPVPPAHSSPGEFALPERQAQRPATAELSR
jgi:MFS family permease